MKKKWKYLISILLLLMVLFLGNYLARDKQDLDDLFALHHTKENRSNPVRQSDVEQYMTPLDQELGIPEQKLEYISNALEQKSQFRKNCSFDTNRSSRGRCTVPF